MEQKNKMILKGGIVVIVLLAVVCLFSIKSGGGKKVEDLLDLGWKYLDEMDYEAAIAVFDEVIAIDPKCEDAYIGKATAQWYAGYPEEAIATLEAGMEIVDDIAWLQELLDEILDEEYIGYGDEDSYMEVESESKLILNYAEIVRSVDTMEPEIQLEVLDDGSPIGELRWESDNTGSVTVSEDGLVTCLNEPGYTYISVYEEESGRYGGCQVYIYDDDSGYETEYDMMRVPLFEDGNIQYITVSVLKRDDNEDEETALICNSVSDYIYYAGDVVIPETLTYQGETMPVTGISSGSFRWCDGLQSIEISAFIDAIDDCSYQTNPFMFCSQLKEINVAEENEQFQSIDGILFSKDGKMLIAYPAGREERSYTIPKEVEIVCTGAFAGCQNLENIQVEEGNANYESIDGVLIDKKEQTLLAYPSGKEEKQYITPEGIHMIGTSAFYKSNLETLTCSAEITDIMEGGIHSCRNLKRLEGEGMKNIEYLYDGIIRDCPALEKVQVGEGTELIRFYDMPSLELSGLSEAINLRTLCFANNQIKNLDEIQSLPELCELEVDMGHESINGKMFDGLEKLTSIRLINIGELKEISFLSGLNNLQNLQLTVDKFEIEDLTPLFDLKNILYISIESKSHVADTAVSEEMKKQIEQLKTENPERNIHILDENE